MIAAPQVGFLEPFLLKFLCWSQGLRFICLLFCCDIAAFPTFPLFPLHTMNVNEFCFVWFGHLKERVISARPNANPNGRSSSMPTHNKSKPSRFYVTFLAKSLEDIPRSVQIFGFPSIFTSMNTPATPSNTKCAAVWRKSATLLKWRMTSAFLSNALNSEQFSTNEEHLRWPPSRLKRQAHSYYSLGLWSTRWLQHWHFGPSLCHNDASWQGGQDWTTQCETSWSE